MRKNDGGVPTYCGVHTRRYVYVVYVTGKEELYDLARDPYELRNRASQAAYADIRRRLRHRLVELCEPAPPGFLVTL